ncbi:NAD-dependent epimerase [Microbulbifer flavimaris]|uniref:NAD-dependent epimerase n=1 Tax=Microbulbifer flavimaris TaxID=1781068 RepID=A0ABX4HX14_9GAMM|nr:MULTISPECIES: NAD-dependent epimerase [Microbulbifer]KUJ82434.1 protein CapI [Microbulbifer sp. ZGT114]PCO04642.1 NAD-dependent epimerase [Microbulbifer flavimaris]
MKFLVTGAAGFIGSFVAEKLCNLGHEVVGVDNLNSYYDPKLKNLRLMKLQNLEGFRFIKLDLADRDGISSLFARENFKRVIHLGAQAGVRYSIENPMAYVDSNLTGMMTILEGCRHHKVEHLVYASSSSVYGMNEKVPFAESDRVDHPVSLYAATKKSNELLAHSYSHLYGLPTTGLRFFTVYGPWGRPDMAPYLFLDAIANDRPINVFNGGKMKRDFTYIDDIVEGVVRVQDHIPYISFESGNVRREAPYSIYNIGNSNPVELESFIACLERALGKKAKKNYLPMQDGDVTQTFASTEALAAVTGYQPCTEVELGVKRLVEWYLDYNKLTGVQVRHPLAEGEYSQAEYAT